MITTNNNTMESPTASFADLLASKLSHTDVVSSDIQHAMLSLFGNSNVDVVTANLMAANDEVDVFKFDKVEPSPPLTSFTNYSGTELKVLNGEETKLQLGIIFDTEKSDFTNIDQLINEQIVCDVTQSVFGESVNFRSLCGFSTYLRDSKVQKLSLEFSVNNMGLVTAERLVENFFRDNQHPVTGDCVIFDALFNVVSECAYENLSDAKVRPTLPICPRSDVCYMLESAVHELGAYQSARKQAPRLLGREIFERIMRALSKLYRELSSLFPAPTKSNVYPIFMRRMLLSQFQY